MKKIIASDYDGTLFLNGAVDEETKEGLRQWRKAGNLFGLVTGRDRLMSRDALREEGIEADFLVCNNGTVLLDREYRILHHSCIPLPVILELIESPILRASRYIVLADPRGRYVYDDDYTPEKHRDLYYTEVLNRHNVKDHDFFYQMDTRYPDAAEMERVGAALEARFGGQVTVNRNVTTIDLTPPGVTKLTGLRRYLEQSRLEGWDIITVGDGLNDLPMIDHYRGYTMEWAVDAIKLRAPRGIVRSVSEIIRREL